MIDRWDCKWIKYVNLKMSNKNSFLQINGGFPSREYLDWLACKILWKTIWFFSQISLVPYSKFQGNLVKLNTFDDMIFYHYNNINWRCFCTWWHHNYTLKTDDHVYRWGLWSKKNCYNFPKKNFERRFILRIKQICAFDYLY